MKNQCYFILPENPGKDNVLNLSQIKKGRRHFLVNLVR